VQKEEEVGRPKGRWVDVVNNAFRKVGVRNWRTEGKDRYEW